MLGAVQMQYPDSASLELTPDSPKPTAASSVACSGIDVLILFLRQQALAV